MGKASKDIPTLRFGNKIYPEDQVTIANPWSAYWYVDGDTGADSAGNGITVDDPLDTVQQAVTNSVEGDIILVKPKTPGIWDPVAYSENVIVPYGTSFLSIIGVSTGPAFGALPHIGTAAASACITLRAPGCRVSGLSMAGTGQTVGGGVNLDDDGSTKAAYGTTIDNNYFYECPAASTVGNGGGVYWTNTGGAWQLQVLNNRFMSCSAGVSLLGTTQSRPTDVVIRGNSFDSWVNTQTDCDIYLAGGSGVQGLLIDGNYFGTVDGVNRTEDHYMDLTGCEGLVSNNVFACKSGSEDTPLTFGASTHTGAKIPATVRMAGNHGEGAVGSKAAATGIVFRQD